MTVKELIEKLSKLEQDSVVIIKDDDTYTSSYNPVLFLDSVFVWESCATYYQCTPNHKYAVKAVEIS